MKIQSYSGTVPGTSNNKEIQFTKGGQSGGTTYAKGQTQNRKSMSPSYRTCDNLFVFLDSVFDDFPAGPVTNPQSQAAWQQASDDAIGWQVCGCSLDTPNGKTFHRCYNFFNLIMGFAVTNTAPNPSIFVNWTILSLTLHYFPALDLYDLQVTAAAGLASAQFFTLNIGQCLANGFYVSQTTPVFDLTISGAQGRAILQGSRNGTIGWCAWSQFIIPCQSGRATVSEV